MNNITLNNIEQVLGAREPELSQNLTKLFAKLLERNQDPTFVQNYTVSPPRILRFMSPSGLMSTRVPSKSDFAMSFRHGKVAILSASVLLAEHAMRQGS